MSQKNMPHLNAKIAKTQPKRIVMGIVVATARPRKTPEGQRYYVREDGRSYWQARKNGSRDDRETVWTDWATREEAVSEIAKRINEGLESSKRSSREAGGNVRTMADLLDAWIAEQDKRQSLADSSKGCYRYKAGYWKEAAGTLLASRFDRADAENVVTDWDSEEYDLSPRTIDTAVRVLKMAVKWGSKRGYCQVLDLSKLAPTVREDEHRYCEFTPRPDQAALVIEHIEHADKRDALALQAIVGARVGEIAAASAADFDRVRGTLKLHGKDPGRSKTGKHTGREFPLPPEGRAIVVGAINRNGVEGYLFPKLGANPAPTLNNTLRIACKAVGVPRFSTHGLRRMVVMRFLDAGVDAKTVSKLTGHSVKTLLTYYVRPTEESLRAAVDRLPPVHPAGQVIEFPQAAGVQPGGTE